MINLAILIPILTTFFSAAVVASLLHASRRTMLKRRAFEGRRRHTTEEIRELLQKYGFNTNAFLGLYRGFESFGSRDGVEGAILYVDTPGAWVGAGEPLCAAENQSRFLRDFAEAARMVGKTALFLPVSQSAAELAAKAGYGSVMIGTEPLFKLSNYPPSGRTWLDMVPTARQLYSRGAHVKQVDPRQMADKQRDELEQITNEWFGSRKMTALGFLNRVEPWTFASDKKFFTIDIKGRVLAFVAAIPIWPRKGWYLVDVMRRQDTPPGTTELLLLETIRALREQGAEEVSLGVAPLAGMEDAPAPTPGNSHELLYRALRFVYEKGNLFYNFSSLHQYKLKFEPNAHAKAFLIYAAPRLRLKDTIGLFQAFLPRGLIQAMVSGLARMLGRFSLSDWIRSQLSRSIVVRSVPPNLHRLLLRCRLTTLLLIANAVVFMLTSDKSGHIHPDTLNLYAFSLPHMKALEWKTFFVSPFLHWDLYHLEFNILLLIVFCGGLEYLAGSLITGLCFFVAALITNPITVSLLAMFFREFHQHDIGASLGIMACAGAFSQFVRLSSKLIWILIIGSVASVFNSWNGMLSLNHLVALLVGIGIAKIYFRN